MQPIVKQPDRFDPCSHSPRKILTSSPVSGGTREGSPRPRGCPCHILNVHWFTFVLFCKNIFLGVWICLKEFLRLLLSIAQKSLHSTNFQSMGFFLVMISTNTQRYSGFRHKGTKYRLSTLEEKVTIICYYRPTYNNNVTGQRELKRNKISTFLEPF